MVNSAANRTAYTLGFAALLNLFWLQMSVQVCYSIDHLGSSHLSMASTRNTYTDCLWFCDLQYIVLVYVVMKKEFQMLENSGQKPKLLLCFWLQCFSIVDNRLKTSVKPLSRDF